MAELHEKYAPILRFQKDEQFFPMLAEDMLKYSSLHAKGESKPIVKQGQLTPSEMIRHGRSPEVFLRSVNSGPMQAKDVISEWSSDAVEMVYRWSASMQGGLTDAVARKAYSWFKPKNRKAAEMFWWNGLLNEVAKGNVKSGKDGELPRLTLPTITHQSALDKYKSAKPGYAYYYRQMKQGDYLSLQYWFFYSYNDWGSGFAGMNDHEGDWEGMMLFFKLKNGRPQEPPAFITYADHESRQTKRWKHPDFTFIGNHPVGYVGAGSHATYPDNKDHVLMAAYNLVDRAPGDGLTIDYDDWVHRVNLDDARWMSNYKGSFGTRFWLPLTQAKNVLKIALSGSIWGSLISLKIPDEVELPGVSAPRGPVGPHRPQYANPLEWAGVPPEE